MVIVTMREHRETEIPINLNLSVEVWFGYRKNDISVAVLTDGVNDVVTCHFTWDDLYYAMDYDEPNKKLQAQAKREVNKHKKAVLKSMKRFIESKGYR